MQEDLKSIVEDYLAYIEGKGKYSDRPSLKTWKYWQRGFSYFYYGIEFSVEFNKSGDKISYVVEGARNGISVQTRGTIKVRGSLDWGEFMGNSAKEIYKKIKEAKGE